MSLIFRTVAGLLLVISAFAFHATAQQPASYDLQSPNRHIQVHIQTGERLTYDVAVNGKTVLRNCTLSIDIDHKTLGLNPRVKSATPGAADHELQSAVPLKSKTVRENYKDLRLEMEGDYKIVFRAYDEGVAYRVETSLSQPEVKVYAEEMSLNFGGDYSVYYPKEESFFSHNEREFVYLPLKDIATNSLASLPAVVDTKDGVKLAIAESDVDDYPGLWLRGNSNNSLSATFPPYPLKEELRGDRNLLVTQAADYLAVTKGTRTYPWRIIGVAEKVSKKLAENMEKKKRSSKAIALARRRKLVLGLKEQLMQTKEGNMQGKVLGLWLKKLQDEFVIRMAAIEEDLEQSDSPETDSESQLESMSMLDVSGSSTADPRYEMTGALQSELTEEAI